MHSPGNSAELGANWPVTAVVVEQCAQCGSSLDALFVAGYKDWKCAVCCYDCVLSASFYHLTTMTTMMMKFNPVFMDSIKLLLFYHVTNLQTVIIIFFIVISAAVCVDNNSGIRIELLLCKQCFYSFFRWIYDEHLSYEETALRLSYLTRS